MNFFTRKIAAGVLFITLVSFSPALAEDNPEGSPVQPSLPASELPIGEGKNLEDTMKATEGSLPSNLPKFNLEKERNPIKAAESIFLNYVISPVFLIAGGVAVIVILYSSFQIITARGEEETLTAAKTTLTWAFLGLGLIMIAYTLISNLGGILLQLFGR